MRRLLIRPGGIGDCITCFPVMEWLRADYTEVWVPGVVAPLVEFADTVRAISKCGIDLLGLEGVPVPEGLRARLAEFDEIVSWYGSNRPAFREAATLLNGNWRFYPALPPAGFAGHVTDFHAAGVGAPKGLRPAIPVRETRTREGAVIHPFSGSRRKNWPLERFQELARRLPLMVDWTAGPDEELPGAVRFEDLRELARWLAGAVLYLGNDSGITHLAAAVGVPTVALFGETDPKLWAPRGERVVVVSRPSMNDIDVENVLRAIGELTTRQPQFAPAEAS